MESSSQSALSLPDLPGIGEGWELLLPAAERARRCTGSSAVACEAKREAIIGACVSLGTRRVAEAFGVSREVVRALRAEAIRDGKLDHLKEEMGRRALGAADAVLDRLVDEVDQLPRASLALTYGILKDKGLLLTGQPTARIEHVSTVGHDDLNAMIAGLPSANPVCAGENPEHKAADLVQVEAGEVMACDTPTLASCPVAYEVVADAAKVGHKTGSDEVRA